jgi:glyoxylase-like metal-dependent hydrolase (beta-lactamase superfamily II)
MRTTALTDHVTQLTRLGIVNAYLVREDDGLTLVDTMIAGSAPGLIAAAADLEAPIRRVALTHGHSDHVGSLDALRQALGEGVEVLAPARDARIMAGDKSLDATEGERRIKGGWPKLASRLDVLLEPGDRVGNLEVHASPGHTPGHVSLLDSRDRTLICGDAFSTLGGTTVAGHLNWRVPPIYFATWDPDRALASARALGALEPSLLAPGHGKGVPAPGEAIRAAIAKAER